MVHGDVSTELATAIIQALPDEDSGELITYQELAEWPESLQPQLGKWVGLFALCFDPSYHGWIVALRVEQVETVRWGGQPEKIVKVGPLGPRLTPRGSFAEWRETVRNKATPWRSSTLEIARQLLGDLR
jgi:light-regulated signal transduction histidine kinase (bacteriophytochrome)